MQPKMRFAALLPLLFAGACGGGPANEADEPDCPTHTPGAPLPTATTTVDPRCVERATERGGNDDQAAQQVWKGTVHQVYKSFCTSEATSPAELTVSGPDGRFEMTVAFTQVASDCPVPLTWGSGPVTGHLTQDKLAVEGGPILTGTVGRSGDRINGSYTNPLPADASQTYTTAWNLKCERGCGS